MQYPHVFNSRAFRLLPLTFALLTFHARYNIIYIIIIYNMSIARYHYTNLTFVREYEREVTGRAFDPS